MVDTNKIFNEFKKKYGFMNRQEKLDYLRKMGFKFIDNNDNNNKLIKKQKGGMK